MRWLQHDGVFIVGDGAEWIWERATGLSGVARSRFLGHCMEYAWAFARCAMARLTARLSMGSPDFFPGVELNACKGGRCFARLKRSVPSSAVAGELDSRSATTAQTAARAYDEYLRLGYGSQRAGRATC